MTEAKFFSGYEFLQKEFFRICQKMLELDLDLVRLSQIRLMDEQRVAEDKFFSE